MSLAHLELRVGIRHTGVRLNLKSKTTQFLFLKTVLTKLSLLPWKVLEPILLQMGEGRLLIFSFLVISGQGSDLTAATINIGFRLI